MTESEALQLCANAKANSPHKAGVYHVCEDVATALGANATTPHSNRNFSNTNKKINGEDVVVFHRAGSEVHYGPLVPQSKVVRVKDAHLHNPKKQPSKG